MAQRYERGLFDPDAAPGESVFDHTIWCFASDGDMEEGISGEASSLAGHQQLGNLVLLYDDNHISIEGDTKVAFSEDVAARYAAYGWHVQHVDDVSDVEALNAALDRGPRRDLQAELHLGALDHRLAGADQAEHRQGPRRGARRRGGRRRPRRSSGFDPKVSFYCPDEVLAHTREVVDRGRELHAEWQDAVRRLGQPRTRTRRPSSTGSATAGCPRAGTTSCRTSPARSRWPPGRPARRRSTRSPPAMPEFWGGSADLAESNQHRRSTDADSFLPEAHGGSPYGRILHFGIREHAMGAILNGITLHGGTRVFGGTFLTFSDYMRGAVRLAALMKLPVTYVWTHDSIGLGEDGPTHQPVEQLAALRAIPGLDVVRPADANETTIAWRTILEHTDRPGRAGAVPAEPAR